MKPVNISNAIRKFKYKKSNLLSRYHYNNNLIKLPYPPCEVFIEPTNHCNLRCLICPHSYGLKREKGFMSLDTFKKVLNEAIKAKVLKITLHFAGESLLNKDIFEMIYLAKLNRLYTRMHTNATLLSRDYARRIIESGLDELSFSFDDPRKEVYEKIRVNASFESALANIKFFLELKKSLKAKKPFTILQRIKFDNNGNIDKQYKKLFAGLGVNKFHTIITHNWAGSCQDAQNAIKRYGLAKSPCKFIWSRFAIGWDGKVYACCNEMNGNLPMGDLNTAGLLDIWNGPQMINLRSKMLGSSFSGIEICKDCDVLLKSKTPPLGIFEKFMAKIFLGLGKL